MPVANLNGLEIAYDVIGDGPQTWALTPGGRFSKDYGGVRELSVYHFRAPTTRCGTPSSSTTHSSGGSAAARIAWRSNRAQGLSQAGLAGRAGVSVSVISRLERQACRSRTLARLAAALGEEPAALASEPDSSDHIPPE